MDDMKPRKRGLFGHGSLLDNIRSAQQAANPAPAAPPDPATPSGGTPPDGRPGAGRPVDDRKIEHPVLVGILVVFVIGGVVLLGRRATQRVQAVVKDYVSAIREDDAATAYGMVSAQQREGLSLERWQRAMHTDLLAHSTGLDIARTRASSAGKGCVVLSVERDGKRVALTFFVADESFIHAVYANQDFNGSPGPWNCD